LKNPLYSKFPELSKLASKKSKEKQYYFIIKHLDQKMIMEPSKKVMKKDKGKKKRKKMK